MKTKKPTPQEKICALRQMHLVQSLGWKGAQEHLASLSEEEKRYYFPKR